MSLSCERVCVCVCTVVCEPCQAAPLYSMSVLIKSVGCQSQAGAPEIRWQALISVPAVRDLMNLQRWLFKECLEEVGPLGKHHAFRGGIKDIRDSGAPALWLPTFHQKQKVPLGSVIWVVRWCCASSDVFLKRTSTAGWVLISLQTIDVSSVGTDLPSCVCGGLNVSVWVVSSSASLSVSLHLPVKTQLVNRWTQKKATVTLHGYMGDLQRCTGGQQSTRKLVCGELAHLTTHITEVEGIFTKCALNLCTHTIYT